MIQFEKFILKNGLTLITHEDMSTPFAAINILYKVGSRNELPDKTGFAHLFEHLMFGGSKNITNFDGPLQRAGGESNAFTNVDITNYYDLIPAANIETGLWLESDRMMSLDFSQHSLDVQKKVVVEEFKENYINQPYGDVWHQLMNMAYRKHSYRWPTIGIEPAHIEDASLEDVRKFFFRHYLPDNAIVVIAGGVKSKQAIQLVEKWFGEIHGGYIPSNHIASEPPQTAPRSLTVHADVPVNCIFKAYHMCDRNDPAYYAVDLISDLLSNGDSSRLHQALVKDNPMFSSISAYVSGTVDAGLFIVEGKLNDGISSEAADHAIQKELSKLVESGVQKKELEKVKNQVESALEFSEVEILHRAMNLAYFEMLGNVDLANQQAIKYREVTPEKIKAVAGELLRSENCSTLHYLSNQKN